MSACLDTLLADRDLLEKQQAAHDELQRALAVGRTIKQALDVSMRAAFVPPDTDYGRFTGHPADPRTEPNATAEELSDAITEAFDLLVMARGMLEDAEDEATCLAVRSIFNEARAVLS